jgi:hypothetical protein
MLTFRFLSKREKRIEEIQFEVTETGWFMYHPCYSGEVDPYGFPDLERCIEENYSAYPSAFPDALEELWQAAVSKKLSEHELQESIDAFSKWIMSYEMAKNASPWKGKVVSV